MKRRRPADPGHTIVNTEGGGIRYVFADPEPARPRRESNWCLPGEATRPRNCTAHTEHHWCHSCVGFYGVPHEGPMHGVHRWADQCGCRQCRTYVAGRS